MPFPVTVIKNVAESLFGDLLEPESTDNSDFMVCIAQNKIPKYRPDGSVYCEVPKTPAPNSPRVHPSPVVSTPPTPIYIDRVIKEPGEREIVYVPVPYIPPRIPTRRLARNAPVDTRSTQTSPGKTIKVNYTLDSLDYGALLHEPITYSNLKIRACVQNGYDEDFRNRQREAALNFFRAIGAVEEDNELKEIPIKKGVTDVALALFSRHIQTFTTLNTKTVPIFGCEGIAELIDKYLNKGYANFTPISTVPTSWQIEDVCSPILFPLNNKEVNDILKLVETVSANENSEIAKRLGIKDFPITVPESLITKKNDKGEVMGTKTKEIETLTGFVAWFFERFDEIMGQFEIPIEIKDTDPATAGDQSKTMKFPNIAETLAEMMMILMQVSIDSELHTNIITRILVEAGQDKKQNFITYKSVESLVDFLGYKIKNK